MQGELNTFQELVTTCRLILPQLEGYVRQLSPAVQAAAFEQQLPAKLLSALLPELPGGIKVYSVGQLLEYLKEQNSKRCYDLLSICIKNSSLLIWFLFILYMVPKCECGSRFFFVQKRMRSTIRYLIEF
jgi:hypothetical protein